jgi:hypothetical protein
MPTGARGEAILTVDGQRYEVLFTNRALAEAEALTGKTVTQLLDRAAIGMTDLAGLLLVGMEAARRDTDPKRVRYVIADAWDLIDKAGFLPVLRAVTESLVAVLTYSGEEEQVDTDPPA